MKEQILEIVIDELRVNNEMNFMDIVKKVWSKGIECNQQTVANILHIHCINHRKLRKEPYFEKVRYGIWKLCDGKTDLPIDEVKTLVEDIYGDSKDDGVDSAINVIEKEIHNFFDKYKVDDVDFYGEAELQMKLGWHFMKYLPRYRIEAERPISAYGINEKFNKKEIDLVLIDTETDDKYVIELKCHFARQRAYNKRIHSTLKDIEFLENLKDSNAFKKVISVCFTNSHYYYEIPDRSNAQYNDFRRYHRVNKGRYTLTNESDVNIKNDYSVNWIELKDKMRYFILEV
ncbi:MAG: hypothetical protein RSD47_02675 [Romboutsia sp.]